MNKQKGLASSLCLYSALLIAGCNNSASSETVTTNNVAAKDNNPIKAESQIPMAMNIQEQAKFATEHLMKKLQVSKTDVKVLTMQSVTWRSSAVGCPTPGERYMQALVPGTLIVLAAGGQHYRYHAKRFGEPFYCEATKAESPASENSDI